MKTTLSGRVSLALLAGGSLLLAGPAPAQGWKPERAVELTIPAGPGGSNDITGRIVQKIWDGLKLLPVPSSVVNRGGGGHVVAYTYLKGRAGDPHVVSVSSVNLTTDHLLGAAPFYHERAFTPLAILYTEYIAFISRSDSAFASGAEFVKRLSDNPKDVTISLSTSLGNPNHIAVAKVIKHSGAAVTAPNIRVFDSARDVVSDIVAGNADVGAITAASAVPELEAGQVRAIAALFRSAESGASVRP